MKCYLREMRVCERHLRSVTLGADWHFFEADLLREENRRAEAARAAWLNLAASHG